LSWWAPNRKGECAIERGDTGLLQGGQKKFGLFKTGYVLHGTRESF
jgi:hypothetical protein